MAESVLSDGTIRRLVESGRIVIRPFDPGLIQPASIDVRLGDSFRVFHNHRAEAIDLRAGPPPGLTEEVTVAGDEGFVIHPGEFCLGRTEEWVELPDDVVARIEGKALALDTEVPTPSGWTTMGDIQPGDEVFGPDGRPLRVTGATGVITGRPCREVVFSDGTSVVADIHHQWEVLTRRSHGPRRRQILNTAQIERTLKYSRTEDAHHIEQAPPVPCTTRQLPIDPYVLGTWIGDGTSTQAILTCADAPILREIARAGYGVQPTARDPRYRSGGTGRTRDAATGRFQRNDSLSSRLRDLGLLGAKRIPEDYMRADVRQRRALLEGLMDTDEYVDEYGRCELTTVKADLARQYCELVASLGHRPRLAVNSAWLDGKDCGPKYEVCFTPTEPVFRLPRKLARQKLGGRFYRGRAIVEVRPVESVPVRCIQVASGRGLYLITRSFIPTHNSSLGRLGLIVHATAGFIDPGWRGTLTLELNNLTRVPIKLYPGLLIAQLSFMGLDRAAERPYGSPELGSHYQGQVAATESRYMR